MSNEREDRPTDADLDRWAREASEVDTRGLLAWWARLARTVVPALVAEVRELRAERARLAAMLDAFATTAEAAVREHLTRGKGGQQVPFHGDFANVPPSAVGRLRWWAREMRAVLGEASGGGAEGSEGG